MEKFNYDFGVTLTGGGARGSYQAGVLKGLIEILKEQDLLGSNNPFKYWAGVSAGSINTSFMCSAADDLDNGISRLLNVWGDIKPGDVYLTDLKSLGTNGAKWVSDLTFGSLFKKKLAKSLLDTKPLWDLLNKNIVFENIQKNLDAGYIKGLACSAYSYYDNRTVTFLQTNENTSWDRNRRYSKKTNIGVEHVVASCAIPVLFPSIQMGQEYFADGGFRNISPISPVLQMGAKKVLVIGVRGTNELSESKHMAEPGIGKISGTILNALFFDTIDIDLERVRHINELITATKGDIETKRSSYSRVEYFLIRPSIDVGGFARQKAKSFPRLINFLLGGLGGIAESAEVASYILFVSDFTRDLIEIGYNDIMSQKNTFLSWMEKEV